jgi:hypothetical protein
MPFQFGACRDQPGAPWRAFERSSGEPTPLAPPT